MARHKVTVTIPRKLTVSNADLEFEVERNEQHLGTLKISKGGIEWRKRHAREGAHLEWKQFADLFEERP